jgi:hypothetical protein
MPWHVPIFLFFPYGTIIAIGSFCSVGKILCNFGMASPPWGRFPKGRGGVKKGIKNRGLKI